MEVYAENFNRNALLRINNLEKQLREPTKRKILKEMTKIKQLMKATGKNKSINRGSLHGTSVYSVLRLNLSE